MVILEQSDEVILEEALVMLNAKDIPLLSMVEIETVVLRFVILDKKL
jgi:hypothetical protein